ncbi:MAG: hypothetical protein SPE41_01310, partial [Eubacteriales bacterium]|nr:hypothetical protein [Eubacteriales bacterium]
NSNTPDKSKLRLSGKSEASTTQSNRTKPKTKPTQSLNKKPSERAVFSIQKRHLDFSEEVDSLGVGQFSNIQQNAALCSAMLSKVHNGAVAIRNGANRGLRTRYLIHSLSQKNNSTAIFLKEVDSYKSESERACTHSEASSTETGGSGAMRRAVYTAQNPRFPA